ncbi:high mobility group AT-hook 1a isoform X3 [Ictalurus furcatus]|uniref:high mobility group AT-hook 1a isoform X3 n=1 Tax=Ictalurus furcatus TaxID=66913 RepID=UPI002350CF2D|nr:high mobility group AT-hook 1a isoform X3 [Ictalurus furcatus]
MLRVRISVSRFPPSSSSSSFIMYLPGFRSNTGEEGVGEGGSQMYLKHLQLKPRAEQETMSETAKDKGAVSTKEKGGAEKRGRGRPRKNPQSNAVSAPSVSAPSVSAPHDGLHCVTDHGIVLDVPEFINFLTAS